MSEPSKAVFLSYASQDAAAAKRIVDALRAAGVEVWFDQSELRGGHAWDAMIRRRIKECALFVPLITPTTNARAEEPVDRRVGPEDFLATLYQHLGIDFAAVALPDFSGRPIPIIREGQAI